jgi:F0F1-type ATP synthase membrane subunit c/vacuolar-type H+-ATPase subunit K
VTVTILVLLGAVTVAPLPLSLRPMPRWLAPVGVLGLLTATAVLSVNCHRVHGFLFAATSALTLTAATFGGMPLPPAAFHIARRQPDTGDPLPTVRGGPLHGGRMVGVLERVAVAAAVISGWPEGMAIVLAIKGLARYPDLRDSKVSEQFIIGTFTSVLWAIAVAALGRHLMFAGPWPPPHEPMIHTE